LINQRIDVFAKPCASDARRPSESGEHRLSRHERALAHGTQLSNRDAIAGNDERAAFVQVTHDSTAVVPKLSLRNASGHAVIVARALRTTTDGLLAIDLRANLQRKQKVVMLRCIA
jgi:hypothetical protein